MDQPQVFWMVSRRGDPRNVPTVEHKTYESAQREAARLASKHIPDEFVVLQSISSYQASAMLSVTDHIEEAP